MFLHWGTVHWQYVSRGLPGVMCVNIMFVHWGTVHWQYVSRGLVSYYLVLSPLTTVFPQLLLIQYGRQSILRNIHTHLTQTNKFPDGDQVLMAHCHVGFTAVMITKEVDSFPTILECQAMETLNSIRGYLACSRDIFLRFACHIFEQVL